MNNINDQLFNILLAIVSILIGLLPAILLPQSRLFRFLLATISYLGVAVAFFLIGHLYAENQQQLQYQVTNQLAQVIEVYANDDYQGSVEPGATQVFTRYSSQDFPLTLRWEVKKYYSFGDDMSETIRKVDVGQTVVVDNRVGLNIYFHPVISSDIGQDCRIIINAGTENESRAGIIQANSHNITPGYFILRNDSNVTLDCDNTPLWYGFRNGKLSGQGLADKIQAGSGSVALLFFFP